MKQQSMFNENEMILKMIIQNKTYEDFFNDQRLFIKLNESDLKYLDHHCGNFIIFINKEIINLKLKTEKSDELSKTITEISTLITSFPLVLNLAWWTNSITLICAIILKFIPDDASIFSVNTTTFIHLSLGAILLAIHSLTLLFEIAAFMNKTNSTKPPLKAKLQ